MATNFNPDNRRAYRGIAAISFALLLGGCGGGTLFALKDPGYHIKPTSVSVITGGSEEADLKLAEYLTKELKEQTTLQVIDQEVVSKAVPSYPIAIKTVEENEGKAAWIDPAEKPKIEKIQARLKTNYVFVIWSKNMMKNTVCSNRGGCTNTYSADVYGNMLEFPGGKIISHTAFNERNSDSVLQLFRAKGYYIDKMLQNSAEGIVDEFIKVTNTGRSK